MAFWQALGTGSGCTGRDLNLKADKYACKQLQIDEHLAYLFNFACFASNRPSEKPSCSGACVAPSQQLFKHRLIHADQSMVTRLMPIVRELLRFAQCLNDRRVEH